MPPPLPPDYAGVAGFHRRLLRDDILPWWLRHAMDPEHGGLFLGMDLHGGECFLPNGNTKIWWPHCEAICGLLLAMEVTEASWPAEWYRRVLDWSLAHFPDREHGEWRQRLDRTGRPLDKVVALPVKDPFHLPRALIYAIESAERLARQPLGASDVNLLCRSRR